MAEFLLSILLSLGLYSKAMIVTETDTVANIVTCEDYNGNLWEFQGVEDWAEGDIVAAVMYNNGTATIYDDEIVMARYNGNVNQ